jgi:hypothetical protein
MPRRLEEKAPGESGLDLRRWRSDGIETAKTLASWDTLPLAAGPH